MEDTSKRFNLRVYALILNEGGQILVSDEKIKGELLTKFPGGGVHYHEGIREALARELKEELKRDYLIRDHFYTTDFYLKSWWDGSTVVNVYYFATPQTPKDKIDAEGWYNEEDDEQFRWLEISALKSEPNFKLPTDLKVLEMLLED